MNGKPVQLGLPVLHRYRPSFCNVAQLQIEQFRQRLVARKRAAVLRDLAQTHIHGLNGIGRIDNPPGLRRVV
jgi:hypothetical protein